MLLAYSVLAAMAVVVGLVIRQTLRTRRIEIDRPWETHDDAPSDAAVTFSASLMSEN